MSQQFQRICLGTCNSAVLLALLLSCTCVQAQLAENVEECATVLKATGAQAVEVDESANTVEPGTGSKRATRQAEKYVSATEAARLLKRPKTVLIDTRRRERFEALRIPGSLNIPGSQIKTKGFLHGKKLLLLGDGYSYRDLERLVEDLEAKGFEDVSIVEGGLNAWRREVGNLQGASSLVRLVSIKPSDYAKEQGFDHWVLVYLAAGDGTATPGPLPVDTVIPHDAEPEQIRSRLKELAQTGRGELKPLVLIVSSDGEGYTRIQAIMRGVGLWNLFYLEGGVDGYQRYLDRLRIMHSRDRSPRGGKPGSCAARR